MTFGDVIDQWSLIRSHPGYDPSFSYLTDLSGVTQYKISRSGVRDLVNTHDPFSQSSRRVVIAPTDILYGMVRMYQMSGSLHPGLIVVRTIRDALRALREKF